MVNLLLKSSFETILMVSIASILGFIMALPLSIVLYASHDRGVKPRKNLYQFLSFFINSGRSIPYLIFTIFLIPFTRLIIGSSIGTLAALVPLTLGASLLMARVIEDAFKTVDKGVIEMGQSFGGRPYQLIFKIVLPESLPHMIAGLTTIIINIVGFSAMAGAVGGGGLGDLAIRYGYQRYDTGLLIAIVVILIIMVQAIQLLGDRLSLKFKR